MIPLVEPRCRYLAVLTCALTLFGLQSSVAQESAAELDLEVGVAFRDCPVCPEMVAVPAGRIMMGSSNLYSDGPMRRVTIRTPFAVGAYEVTFAEWDACVEGGGCRGYAPEDLGWGRGLQPVVNVSFVDAQAYLDWLSSKTGQQYRLLSVAEWEYVARAGAEEAADYAAETDAAECQVDPDLDRDDWHPDWSGCPGHVQTAPVGTLEPSAFGLHDVLGNAWEWTEDCRHDLYRWVPTDGAPRYGDCAERQLRGGSWNLVGGLQRQFFLGGYPIDNREPAAGFRVARTTTPSSGSNIALVDAGYAQMLIHTLQNDRLSLVQALLDAGADPNADIHGGGYTPLFAAIGSGNPRIVTAILEAGADPNATYTDPVTPGETPLHYALKEGAEDLERIAKALLDRGADPNAKGGDGRTPLHTAVVQRRSEEAISVLLDAGADASLTALQVATLQNDAVTVASLLAQGADPNESDDMGWTPLHFAMVHDPPVTINSLLDAGADPNAMDFHGDTPLIRYLDEAASDFDPDGVIARVLLDGGADPNRKGGTDLAPLHFASRYGIRPAVVSALLEAGADPNALDERGNPPLVNHLYLNRRKLHYPEASVAVVEALLAAGADPNLGTGFRNGSPLHIAIRRPSHPDIVALLLDAGADPFARDDIGRLPIDVAEQEAPWLRETDAYERLRSLGRGSVFHRLRRFLARIFG